MEISTYFKHYNFFNDQRHTWNVDVIHFSWTKIFNLDAGSITIFSAEKKIIQNLLISTAFKIWEKQISGIIKKSHINFSISTLQAWHKDRTAVLSKYQIPRCIALLHAFLNF